VALSPNAAWVTAVSCSGARIRFLVDIYDGTTHWQTIDSSPDSGSDLFGTPESVESVATVAAELDPFTRKTQVGECVVELEDGWIRPILTVNRLKGQECEILVGAAELDESDYVAFFAGPIEEIQPDGKKSKVSLSLLDPFTVLNNKEIVGGWVNKHPLEVLYDGAGGGILEKADIPAALIDTSAFDPSGYSGIAHLLISRGGYSVGRYAVNDPRPAFDLAVEVASLINGQLRINEAGQITFSLFDSSAAIVDTWTTDDFGESFEQESLDDNVVNRIILSYARDVDLDRKLTYQVDDTDSQSVFAYPGSSERVITEEIETDWLDNYAHMLADITDVATSLILSSGNLHNVCGNRADAFAAISGTQPVYLLLDSSFVPGINNAEIVKCEALSRRADITSDAWMTDPETGTYTNFGTTSAQLTFSSITRAQLGTTASAHSGPGTGVASMRTKVHDVTIPVLLCDELLKRFKYGCAIISVETSFDKYKYQTGDFIGITFADYLGYGKDGLSAEKFEIIHKEPDFFSSPPKIKWKLAQVNAESLTRSVDPGSLGIQKIAGSLNLMEAEAVTQGAIIDGLTIAKDALLTGTISAGTAASGAVEGALLGDISHVFTASKDTYVTMDVESNTLKYTETALGAGAPTLHMSEVLLAKVVTDATDITSVDTTNKNTNTLADGIITNAAINAAAGIVGTKLAVGAGCLTHLSAGGALDNVTSITTRELASMSGDLDDISDGGTYEKVVGVTSNLITFSSMTAPCVAPRHVLRGDSFDGNMVRNGELQAHSRAIASYPPDLWEMLDGSSAWGADAEWDAALGKIGGGSVKLYAPSGYDCAIVTEETIPVEAGVEYLFSVLCQADARTAGDEVFCDVQWIEDDEETQDSIGAIFEEVVSIVDTWETHSGTDTAPANARWCKVRTGIRDGYGGTDAHIQRVIMVRN